MCQRQSELRDLIGYCQGDQYSYSQHKCCDSVQEATAEDINPVTTSATLGHPEDVFGRASFTMGSNTHQFPFLPSPTPPPPPPRNRLGDMTKTIGREIEDLGDAREELLVARSRLLHQRAKLRQLRKVTANSEGSLMKALKEFFQSGQINYPEAIHVGNEEVRRVRDQLGTAEIDFENAEEEYNVLEWKYSKSERDLLGKVYTESERDLFKEFYTEPESDLVEELYEEDTLLDLSASTVYEIPSILAQAHRVEALGDTAARYNFMQEEYAVRMGFPIHREDTRKVAITKQHSVTTTGTTQVPFRFAGEDDVYSLVFHLLPSCIHSVILGKAFLKATKTFSKLKNRMRRVTERVVQGLSHFHLLYLGESAPKFTGLLNGRPREALADSGANGLIMDEDFARKMGIPIVEDDAHKHTVRFADNTTARTSGMSYGVRWEFGLGGVEKEHLLDFHILKNAPANVILSDEFLFGTNAFAEYDCYLVDEDDEDEEADAYFHGIRIDKSHKTAGT